MVFTKWNFNFDLLSLLYRNNFLDLAGSQVDTIFCCSLFILYVLEVFSLFKKICIIWIFMWIIIRIIRNEEQHNTHKSFMRWITTVISPSVYEFQLNVVLVKSRPLILAMSIQCIITVHYCTLVSGLLVYLKLYSILWFVN